MDNVTRFRLAVLMASGFASSNELAKAVLDQVQFVGTEALRDKEFSPDQTNGLKLALNDTPLTYTTFLKLITDLPTSDEIKQNLLFMLVKMMDDLFNMGAVIMHDKKEADLSFSVINGGRAGGKRSGEIRSKKRKEGWEPIAREMIVIIRTEHPRFSQDDVASDVIAGWKFEEPRPPGPKRIKDLVSMMEREGDVPKRRK